MSHWDVLHREISADARNASTFIREAKTTKKRQHWTYVRGVLREVLKDMAAIKRTGKPRWTK